MQSLEIKERRKNNFGEFQDYCQLIEQSLNKLEGYSARYKRLEHPFAKQHDAQYLQVIYTQGENILKFNFCYSIAYQIPLFYFMAYDSNCQPFPLQKMYETFIFQNKSNEQLNPANDLKGIYLSQNPITREYFYTLHHCEMGMSIEYLFPFYFSLLGLHPPLLVDQHNY